MTPAPPPLPESFSILRPFGNPMLAAKIKKNNELYSLRYPIFVQPKVDGYRILIKGGKAYSRSLKLMPNKHVQAWVLQHKVDLEGLDGELVVGPAFHEDVFKRTRKIAARDAKLDFSFIAFDVWNQSLDYRTRLELAHMQGLGVTRVFTIDNNIAHSPEEVLRMEEQWLEAGYEGIILRDPKGRYKNNRSTIKEGGLMALKRWSDDVAVIKSVEPLQKNMNEAYTDERGFTKRSSSQAGKVAQETLGRLVCDFTWPAGHKNAGKTIEIRVGSGKGMDAPLRKKLWQQRHKLPGMHVEFEYFEPGSDEAPRHIKFRRIREKWDL